jgi:hypothetical protein
MGHYHFLFKFCYKAVAPIGHNMKTGNNLKKNKESHPFKRLNKYTGSCKELDNNKCCSFKDIGL